MMLKILVLSLFLLKLLNADFIADISTDVNSLIRNDFRVEIFDKNFDGRKFPSILSIFFNNEKYDFAKKLPLDKNAHGVLHLNEDKTLTKNQNTESMLVQDYIQLNGDGFLTLIREEQSDNGKFFRMIGKIFKNGQDISIDIIPIFKRSENREKRSLNENLNSFQKISKNSDQIAKPNFIINKNIQSIKDQIKAKNLKLKSTVSTGVPVSLDVEVLVVTDSSVFDAHRAFLKTTNVNLTLDFMRIYYSHLINQVNSLFQNSFSNDPHLRINIKASDFLFITRQIDSPWSNPSFTGDNFIISYRGKRVIIDTLALDSFRNSMNAIRTINNYDHVIGFMNRDIWYSNSVSSEADYRSLPYGISYSTGICTGYKYSLIEDYGGFSNIHFAAHHIARNLGAEYDSYTNTNCLAYSYFIMSPLFSLDTQERQYNFSSCSKQDLKLVLLFNNSVSSIAQCLLNKSPALNLISSNNNRSGLFYSLNDQCKMRHGSNAFFAQDFADDICKQLYCDVNDSKLTFGPAVDGTICGSGKICQNGDCIASSLVKQSECPFGDEPVITNYFSDIELVTKNITCTEYFKYLVSANISVDAYCLSIYSTSCCQSCQKYKALKCADTEIYCPYYKSFCNYFTTDGESFSTLCPYTCGLCKPLRCSQVSSICQNGGTCVSGIVPSTAQFGFTCSCMTGFSGDICQTKNPCLPNPCQNNGVCTIVGDTTYVCRCTSNFDGDNCSLTKNGSLIRTTVSTRTPTTTSTRTTTSTPRRTLTSTRTTTSTARPTTSSVRTNTSTARPASTSTRTTTSTTRSSTTQQIIPGLTNYGKTCVFGKSFSFCDVCGIQPIQPNVKIVGGINALKNSWPSLAFLVMDYTYKYTFNGQTYSRKIQSYCGAVLIDRTTVITAAHCYEQSTYVSTHRVTVNFRNDPLFPSNAYKVYLGLHNTNGLFSGTADLTGVSVMAISNIINHENYDDATHLNDIAVIKLKTEVKYTSTIQPACLPPSKTYKPTKNVPAWIAGWGSLSSGGDAPDILQNVKITYYFSGYECRNLGSLDWDKQICAGEYDGGKDTCQGDSGGPLYILDGNTFIFVGATSFGVGCGDPGYPGIYTRVAFYLDWILSKM